MDTYNITKTRFQEFLAVLLKKMPVFAPLKKDLVRFQELKQEDIAHIHLVQNAYFPLKEFFFPHRQSMFTFTKTQIKEPVLEQPQRAFFGVRKCDLNAVHHQDMVFLKDANDPYYAALRKNSFLLGYHCNTAPSPYCFCGSLDLIDCFDLMFYDQNDHFLVEVGSEKGALLLQMHASFFTPSRKVTQDERKIIGADRLEKKDISQFYDHPSWQKDVNNCLSCGACTALCPTCYCFDIHDEIKKPAQGERIRSWSSCQLPEFTKVAGGHVFREDRAQRFKHRIYHQLDYFKKRYGVNLCVGCGRCIQGCPTRIDFVKTINEMT